MVVDLIVLNRNVLITSVFVTIVSIIIFVLNSVYPIVNQLLASSIYTPWGILTSIFVHGNFAHISFNLLFLWIWTVFIVFQNDILKYVVLKRDEIKKRLKFSILSIFGSAIISNIVWSIILKPGTTTLGSSGIVFAFAGFCLISSLMNISYVLKGIKLKNLHKKINILNIIGNLAMNLMIFGLIFMMVTSDASSFFGFGDPQINSFIHWTSFIITFFSVFAYEYYIFHLPTLTKNIKIIRK